MATGVLNLGDKASGFDIKIHGYSKVLKNLKLTRDQSKNLQAFLEKEAEAVKNTAMTLVHVVTGRLRDSHRVITFGATGAKVVRADVVVGGKVVRGKFVNYAVVQHERHPWLEMALRMHASGYQERLAKAIKIPRG